MKNLPVREVSGEAAGWLGQFVTEPRLTQWRHAQLRRVCTGLVMVE